MAVFLGSICNDHATGLDVGGFKVFEQSTLVSGRRWNAIISDERLCEDQNLAPVGGVSQRLGVPDEGSREDRFARDVRLGAERLPMENRAILESVHVSPFTQSYTNSNDLL